MVDDSDDDDDNDNDNDDDDDNDEDEEETVVTGKEEDEVFDKDVVEDGIIEVTVDMEV